MPTKKHHHKDTPRPPEYKRLDYFARCEIQAMLAENKSLTKIAHELEVSPSTVSREVLRNRINDSSLTYAGRAGVCVIKKECGFKGLCKECSDKLCKSCKKGCRAYCAHYVRPHCPTLEGAPWVCNGCSADKRRICRVSRYLYDAKAAQTASTRRLSESRRGVDLSFDELMALDALIAPLIKNGQSIEEVYLTHGNEIPVTVRTIYTYVSDDVLPSLCNANLNRKLRYSPRLKKRKREPRDIPGRTYADFCALSVAAQVGATEMDTVKGRIGGKALLTLYVRRFDLMFIFLIEDETHDEIMEHLACLAVAMETAEDPEWEEGPDKEGIEVRCLSFGDFFSVILTDNGSCFLGFADIEELGGTYLDGSRKTTVYYCDPYCSFQKGGIERGHEYIREVLPKGTSFDDLTHEDISLLASHINSIPRPSLGSKSPYDLASVWLGEELLHFTGIYRIKPDDIIRKPKLLRPQPNEA